MSINKLQKRIRELKNPSLLDLSIDLERLPNHLLEQEHNEILAYDRFCRELMDAMKDVVPAVRFNMGRFSLLGPDGMFMLMRMTAYAKDQGYYVLLDAPEALSQQAADWSVKSFMSENCPWKFDALVISAYAGSDILKTYTKAIKGTDKDLFVVLRTANKSAPELQDLLTGSRLVHMAAADVLNRFCEPVAGQSGYGQIAAIGPATVSEVLKQLRNRYKGIFILVDGYDYSNANAKNCSYAFDRLGHGAIVCAGVAITCAWDANDGQGEDYIHHAVEAAERMKKNLTRYVTIL